MSLRHDVEMFGSTAVYEEAHGMGKEAQALRGVP